jgi:ferredoxin
MGKKFRIVYDKDICIGALACNAVAPAVWTAANDGKVDLKGATKRPDGKWELLVEEKDFKLNKEAADSCPVYAITIEEVNE